MFGIPNLARTWAIWRGAQRLKAAAKEAKMQGKKWYLSKSLWSAAAKIVAGLFAMLTPELQSDVSNVAGAGLVGMGLLDGLLRVVTDKPLAK